MSGKNIFATGVVVLVLSAVVVAVLLNASPPIERLVTVWQIEGRDKPTFEFHRSDVGRVATVCIHRMAGADLLVSGRFCESGYEAPE